MSQAPRPLSIDDVAGGHMDLPEIARFRYHAWEKSGDLGVRAFEESDWIDGHDSHGAHLLARAEGALVGAVRFCVHSTLRDIPDYDFYPRERRVRESSDLPIGCMNRLVVAPQFQKMGTGGLLLKGGIGRLVAAGVSTIILSANPRVTAFLGRIGFIPVGGLVVDGLKPRLPLQFFLLSVSEAAKKRRPRAG